MPPCACFKAPPLLPEHGDEFVQVLRRKILSRDHDGRRMGGDADRHEVRNRIVFEVWREHRGGHMRAHGRSEQGVAVGYGGRHACAAKIFVATTLAGQGYF